MSSSSVTTELQEKEFFKKIKKLTGKLYRSLRGLLVYRMQWYGNTSCWWDGMGDRWCFWLSRKEQHNNDIMHCLLGVHVFIINSVYILIFDWYWTEILIEKNTKHNFYCATFSIFQMKESLYRRRHFKNGWILIWFEWVVEFRTFT